MDEPKPWKAEYAKSGRAKCTVCDKPIGSGELRLGRTMRSDKFSGWYQRWHHVDCVFDGSRMISSVDDIDQFNSVRWEDQKLLRKCIEGDSGGNDVEEESEDQEEDEKEEDGDDEEGEEDSGERHTIEIAKTSRSVCRVCKDKILNKTARIATALTGNPTFRHVKCFLESGAWKRPIEDMTGWDEIENEEQSRVKEIAKPFKQEKKKREADTSEADARSPKKQKVSEEEGGPEDLEKRLKRQSKALWSIIDNLRTHVSKDEMKEMLEINGGAPSRSEDEILKRCADGMLFGPIKSCRVCSGPLVYDDEQYRCKGNISEWSKCNYVTREVEREAIWKIPKSIKNAFLRKWYKNQAKNKELRALRPPSAQSSASYFLRGLHVYFLGDPQQKSQAEWKQLIEGAGGVVHQAINSGVTLIISTESEISKENSESWRMNSVPIVGERYLADCMEKKTRLSYTEYRLELPKSTTVAKVKVKGRSAVHEDSDMQDQGHILEVGNTVYNVTLNLTDLSRGINKYYVLQIIEEDKSSLCHLFRRWGEVGDPNVGGKKIERLSKCDAIQAFKSAFFEKTENYWEDKDHGFMKRQGKYFPVEIDYGVDEGPQKGLAVCDVSKSRLHPRVISLLQMLFDIEAYRAAMLEFEIDAAKMPLGKLSKRHIARGFEVLSQVEQFLKIESENDRRPRLVEASNKFYTLIPTVNPTMISDEDTLKTKIQMLEALRDIEIASQLISSAGGEEDSDPFELHYKKLKCEISPLDHDSPEFELVKSYLERTHAPTHTEWGLEVEEVFVVKREGEDQSYAPMKSSLKNHMLLWHGSRTTNFVGILSQGLRIAPPEAPVTGYMFGKGVYFADLVSKSAQYCYTSRGSPVGLMLLSEVALGNVKEYTHAQYMDKPPPGYNSTKGVGRSMPEPSEFKTFEEDIVVPCGHPVPARTPSDLLYNEYIVYSTSQISLRFLLKVRFKYKR